MHPVITEMKHVCVLDLNAVLPIQLRATEVLILQAPPDQKFS